MFQIRQADLFWIEGSCNRRLDEQDQWLQQSFIFTVAVLFISLLDNKWQSVLSFGCVYVGLAPLDAAPSTGCKNPEAQFDQWWLSATLQQCPSMHLQIGGAAPGGLLASSSLWVIFKQNVVGPIEPVAGQNSFTSKFIHKVIWSMEREANATMTLSLVRRVEAKM